MSQNISKVFENSTFFLFLGKVYFPGMGWLCLVWETFSLMHGTLQNIMKVVMEDIKFMRATAMQPNQDILITIMIHRGEFDLRFFFACKGFSQLKAKS